MEIVYSLLFFIFGTIFGSFYNVVGDRLPMGESIVSPGSHCPKCKHKLTPIELIPIISYIIQGGKCKKCKCHIPFVHLIYESLCGLLFMLCYLVFGLTTEIIIPITLVSMLLIIVVSDFKYMIIPDEVLIFFGILLVLETILIFGFSVFLSKLISGVISFAIMFLIKLVGDFMFKTESMGGGDIKLLFFFGFTLGWTNALFSIFLGSLIGFPISLVIMNNKKTNIIPFGPFLALGALIILFTKFDISFLLNLLTY